MIIPSNASVPCFFIRPEAIASPEDMLHTQIVQRDLFQKTTDGEVIHFIIAWLMLRDGRITPVVEHLEHLPLLDEVLKALESFHG